MTTADADEQTGVGTSADTIPPSRTGASTRAALNGMLRDQSNRPVLIGAAIATILAIAYLASGLMGGDLSAQMARSEFTREHPFSLIDFRWFGGSLPFGYSLWTTYVMALFGPRLVGAVAAVIATCLTVRLLQRAGARRPVWGAVAAAICQASNLAEGRVTFACGMVCGLLALLLIGRDRNDSSRWIAVVVFAVLAGAASPVAALLLWVVSAALIVTRRIRPAVVLGVAAAVPTAVMVVVFADGGPQPFDQTDALRAGLASVLVALVVPARNRTIRYGALIGLVMVIAAYTLDTSVGGNAMRLTLLFAVPIVAAMVDRRVIVAAMAVLLAIVVQSPVTWGTLAGSGKPQTTTDYYRPLLDQIAARGPLTGRVEIPELNGHWEAVFAAREVPLARGWLRQADTKLNSDPFYGHPLTPESYRRWLDLNAVQYVALPDARLTHTGKREKDLLDTSLPYLSQLWTNGHWTLYSVAQHTPVVDAPGTLVSMSATEIVVDVPANSTVVVRTRQFRYLDLVDLPTGGTACLSDTGRWTVLHSAAAGRYTIGSALIPGHHCS